MFVFCLSLVFVIVAVVVVVVVVYCFFLRARDEQAFPRDQVFLVRKYKACFLSEKHWYTSCFLVAMQGHNQKFFTAGKVLGVRAPQ